MWRFCCTHLYNLLFVTFYISYLTVTQNGSLRLASCGPGIQLALLPYFFARPKLTEPMKEVILCSDIQLFVDCSSDKNSKNINILVLLPCQLQKEKETNSGLLILTLPTPVNACCNIRNEDEAEGKIVNESRSFILALSRFAFAGLFDRVKECLLSSSSCCFTLG